MDSTSRGVKERFDLAGKVAFITGGSGLLGVKHAEAIAEMGGVPVLGDIREAEAREQVARIGREWEGLDGQGQQG